MSDSLETGYSNDNQFRGGLILMVPNEYVGSILSDIDSPLLKAHFNA